MILAKINSKGQKLIPEEDQLSTWVEIIPQGTKLSPDNDSGGLLEIGELDWRADLIDFLGELILCDLDL